MIKDPVRERLWAKIAAIHLRKRNISEVQKRIYGKF